MRNPISTAGCGSGCAISAPCCGGTSLHSHAMTRGDIEFSLAVRRRSNSPRGGSMARIKKVGHVVLGVRDPKKSIEFYTNALGMECINFFEDMQMAFLSFGDERDHD